MFLILPVMYLSVILIVRWKQLHIARARTLIQHNLYPMWRVEKPFHNIINHKLWMLLQNFVECFQQICSWLNLRRNTEILCMEFYEPACTSVQGSRPQNTAYFRCSGSYHDCKLSKFGYGQFQNKDGGADTLI